MRAMKWKRWLVCSECGNFLLSLSLITIFSAIFFGFYVVVVLLLPFDWRLQIKPYSDWIQLPVLWTIGVASFRFAEKIKRESCSRQKDKDE